MSSLQVTGTEDTAAAAGAAPVDRPLSPGRATRRQHPSSTLTTGMVAAELGVSADTVRRHFAEWMRAQGFPPPLPLTGANGSGGKALLRWDADAFAAWKSRRGASPAPEIDTTDWAAVARARGLALDRGQNPDLVAG